MSDKLKKLLESLALNEADDDEFENDDEFEDEGIDASDIIPNPYEGNTDQALGWDASLDSLAIALFGPKGGGGGVKPPFRPDRRLKQPPQPKSKNNKNKNNNQQNQNNQDNQDGQDGENKNKPLMSPEELKDLMDKIEATRDKTKDVIDDYGNLINQNNKNGEKSDELKDLEKAAAETDKALDEIEKEAAEAKAKEDAEKLKKRLDAINTFWDDPQNQENAKFDKAGRDEYNRINRTPTRSTTKRYKINYKYQPNYLAEIIENMDRALTAQIVEVPTTSFSRYNPKSEYVDYILPGHDEEEKRIPSVGLYLDVSSSFVKDKVKLYTERSIREALKRMHNDHKINLACYYFGTQVHSSFTKTDPENNEQPIPHAIELLNQRKLDNVVIITDHEPVCYQKLEVPGIAWLIFMEDQSNSLAENVSGDLGTEIVLITGKE